MTRSSYPRRRYVFGAVILLTSSPCQRGLPSACACCLFVTTVGLRRTQNRFHSKCAVKTFVRASLVSQAAEERPKRIDFLKRLCPILLSTIFYVPCAALATTPSPARLPAPLGMKQLLVGTAFVTSFGGVMMSLLGLNKLAREILFACVRCAFQLFLLGGFVLQKLFGTSNPAIVWTWIVGVGLLAARDAASRVEYTYDKLRHHMTFSVLTSGLGILGLSLAGKVFGDLQPWYQPRTLIPVAGMLFGNTLSAVSLGASSLTKGFAQSQSQVELRLARGASADVAANHIIKSSLSSALTPTVSSLAATGVIHIPGMMTGQVLSGQSPSQAAAYQVLILSLITATACSTVQLLARLVSHELMNMKEHRLQLTGLIRKENGRNAGVSLTHCAPIWSARKIVSALTSFRLSREVSRYPHPLTSTDGLVPFIVKLHSVTTNETASLTQTPVMKVDRVRVERANLELSFCLSPGDRIGITGASGIGKTQVLRTLVGLEHCEGSMELMNAQSLERRNWPEWRRQVCWVSQDRPALDGTPKEFFDEIRTFHSKRLEWTGQYPEKIAARWGLPASVFDRPWTTLSGGEAQRVSLAIALSSEPEVLLLDEVTAALDEATEQLVEKSLADSGIPIIMVTHSSEQLHRFCTHHMDLNGASVS